MTTILDGKKLAKEILEGLKGSQGKLTIIMCGERPDSVLYTNIKKKKGEEIGLGVDIVKFDEDVGETELISRIKNLECDGIIVQLPLPKHLDSKKILASIPPEKDVDGLTKTSLGKVLLGDESFASATPKGVVRLLEEYKIEVKGKEVVIINHSNIVGKPLAMMLVNRGATVTICHEFTKDLSQHTLRADILVSGVGKPNFISKEMVKEGVIIVDVGISKVNEKIVGDVAENVKEKASFFTPVPGGVGPMTVAMLLENVVNVANKNL